MRGHVRNLVTAACIIGTMPLWICALAFRRIGWGDGPFVSMGQFLSLLPGVPGVFLRRAYYLMTLESCAVDVGIGFGTWFSKAKVRIEPRVSIGAHCLIGSCTIGCGTLLGSNIDVLSGRRQHAIISRDRAASAACFEQISLGRNAWIGNRTVIMATVGDDVVIGAGSVVVKPISAGSVAAGNPARPLSQRPQDTRRADEA